MAVLEEPIPDPNFEIIGKRIAEILNDELNYQVNNFQVGFRAPEVLLERAHPPDVQEVPAVIVRQNLGELRDYHDRGATNESTFWVDIYEKASSGPDQEGSALSRIRMKKLLGACWHVLNAQAYKMLGYKPGFVGDVYATRFEFNPQDVGGDDASMAQGRLFLTVVAAEDTQRGEARDLEKVKTTAYLEETDKGYYWEESK